MSVLQIDLFGPFSVYRDGEPVAGLEARKVQELLGLLLLQRTRSYTREVLAELLWGQAAPAQSKKYLRQSLWQIQSALAGSEADPADASPVVADAEWVRFNERCALRLDVAIFEAAYAQTQGIAGSELDGPSAEGLRQAVTLYRGDLLPGCYEDWCIYERERLQSMYLAMLDKLIDTCQAHGEFEAGLDYGATILRYDRARERTHRRMMRLYFLAGDRTSALRQYDQLVRALREELDVLPSRRSVLLRDQIRADSLQVGAPPPISAHPDPQLARSGTGPADPRLHLHRLHRCLMQMQGQIRQEIEAIELALAEA